MDEDLPVKKKTTHEIGQELSLLSIGELTERITLLKEEIARLPPRRAIDVACGDHFRSLQPC